MRLPFKPIKPKRISDQVFEQLRELVFRGEMKPGEKLMPERELASAFGVSRTTVRDAINKLVVMGLLEQKQGQGTFVRSLDTMEKNPLALAMDVEGASLVELLEVRMGIEGNAAAMAARRAVEQDVMFLEKSIDSMRLAVDPGSTGVGADLSFHMAISYASKNPIQIFLMKNFCDLLFVGLGKNLKRLYEDSRNIDRIIRQHTEIAEAVMNRDPAAARHAMERHISTVLTLFREPCST